jgi:hypothetical protein
MRKKKFSAIAIKSFALLVVLGTAYQAMAQDATTPYPNMAPIDQYLMTDQGAEIALARSAAPESISRDAEVLVLGRHGFETTVKGKNGFVCIVARSWTSAPDSDFWNPKVRVPMCVNAAAARSYFLRIIKRTDLILAGHIESSDDRDHRRCHRQKRTAGDGIRGDVLHDVEARIRRRQHRTLASPPHVFLFADRPRNLGSGLPDSPIFASNDTLEHLTTFVVAVQRWSDGTEYR